MNNAQIAEVFENIAGLLEMKGESTFTVRAYQRAARTIERHPAELEQMVELGEDLQQIPGIGKAISDKITELVNTGELGYFERLKADFPPDIMELMEIPGLGPKTIMRLWKELDVTSIAQLEQALDDGRVAALPRMGKKTADNIRKHIQFARSKGTRFPIAKAMPIAERIVAALRERCSSIQKLEIAGSLRRYEETIGDIDLVCTAAAAKEVLDAFVALPGVVEVLGHGEAKASVVLDSGIQVDIRVGEDRQFGSLMQYFLGGQQHNIQLRDHANKMGLSLNEYGIKSIETGEVEEFADEESIYERLGLQFVPPELRTGGAEIELAQRGRIPRLVEIADIRGDLHVHTDWSDGRDPMEVMIAAARERGLEYVAITDHSVGRGIANGLSVERLRSHMERLREIEATIGGIRVLCGTEMDIRADGSLDYPDDVLEQLDWVVGSIHSAMGQDSDKMTERIIMAMRNPHVDAIGHLSTRLIGERQPINADYEAIFRAAAETGTALEINGSPERLDLKDSHVYRARELGAPLVISTDAHTTEALNNNARYGVAVARRGWCEPKHILNTLPVNDFLKYLNTEKPRRTEFFLNYAK
ncbi:MAG: DNA polymerase/3'-5' exonuclease PolX [Chloroflexi bacterium]|nr:DNA polymerase/3'-5' exonuclease PolX [Chloroflexota bacterium]